MSLFRPVILLLLPALILASCMKPEEEKSRPSTVPVTRVISVDTNLITDYPAEVSAVKNVEIRALVSGYLEKVLVDEGHFVKEGQVMFKIREAGYREELNRMKAQYRMVVADARSAEIELENVLQLYRKNVVSATELEKARNRFLSATARVEEARANQESAEHKLAYTSVRAPFSGYIHRIPYKIGSLINEGSLLTTLSENHEVFAYFDVSEKEYLRYAETLRQDSSSPRVVELVLANGRLHDHKGKIETMEGEIESTTGNIAFRARFPNPDRLLKHGASGKVRMTRRLINVLAIPQKATFEIQDKVYVYVTGPGNRVEMRNIQVSHRLSHLFIVSDGLRDMETIVYEGIQNVGPGEVIQPRFVAMNDIFKTLARL